MLGGVLSRKVRQAMGRGAWIRRLHAARVARFAAPSVCTLCVHSVRGTGAHSSKACMCPLLPALESFRFTPPGSFALVYSSSTQGWVDV